MASPLPSVASYRLGVLSRSVAGIFGSYALAAAASLALAQVLPLEKRDAVQLSVMIGFLLYTGGVIWAFSTSTALKAWIGIAAAAAPFLIVLLAVKGSLS